MNRYSIEFNVFRTSLCEDVLLETMSLGIFLVISSENFITILHLQSTNISYEAWSVKREKTYAFKLFSLIIYFVS